MIRKSQNGASGRRLALVLCGAAALLVAGCGSRGPAAPAATAMQITYSAASPLASGPHSNLTVSPASSYGLEITARLLPAMPQRVLRPFASQSTLVSSMGSQTPLQALPASLARAGIATEEEARLLESEAVAGAYGPITTVGTTHTLLAPGLSVRMAIPPADAAVDPKLQQIQLIVYRPAEPGPLRLALSKRGLVSSAADADGSDAKQIPAQVVRETAVVPLDYDGASASAYAIVVPVVTDPKSTTVLLLTLQFSPASDDASRQAAAQEIATALAQETHATEAPSVEAILVQSALQSAETTLTRRAALVYVAGITRATILRDTALIADEAALETLFAQLRSTASPTHTPPTLAALAWTADRVAFELLATRYIQKSLSPELTAVLTAHAGEAGRNVASLEQIVGRTVSRTDLQNRLIAENYIALEDISPAARVRAYDWLLTQGKAPKDYDPLGPASERGKALTAAIEEMTRTTSAGANHE